MNILMMVTWYTKKDAEKVEAGIFHYEQSRDLQKHCNVAIYYPFDQDMEEDMSAEEEWGVMTYRSRFRMRRVFYNRRQNIAAMRRIVEEFHPDIIHAHCATAAGHIAVSLGKKFQIPVVITEHSPVELSGVARRGGAYFLAKYAYKNSRANICVSKDSKNKLSAVFPQYTFDVIYNGILCPEYDREAGQYYREGFLNISIVAILYDLEVKGMKYLLRAMRILKKQGRKICLHHIGGGKYAGHFQEMARELEVDDVCIFHGPCDRKKLYEIIHEMDFCVSASLVECSGVSVQEAMLLGKPVLGTNSGGVDSLVTEATGHIVEKANAQALADGVLYMQEHLDSFDRDEIRDYAYESFEIGNISRKYMELYQRVLEENGM